MPNHGGTLGIAVLAFGFVNGLAGQGTPTPQPAPAAVPDRPVDWVKLLPNVFHDQAKIWSFPAKLTKRKVLAPTLVVVGIAAALAATDAHSGGYFRDTTTFNGNFNRVFNSNATALGTIIAPASFYLVGLARGDRYAQHTALLAGEAVVDSEIVTTVMKDIDHRARPSEYAQGTVLRDSWFDGQGSWIRSKGSFPSGHTIAAFSVATILSRRYPHQRWLPYVAYGLASVVGFSRLTLSAHFPSDVFMGAALGYSISRFVVLRQ